MSKIVYALHLPGSHKLIAEKVESEKPGIYLDEVGEILDPEYNEFLSDPNATVENLQRKISEKGWRVDIKEKGLEKILEVLKRDKIKRVGIESTEALLDYSKFQHNEILPLLFNLSLDKSAYRMNQIEQRANEIILGVEQAAELSFLSEDPVKLKKRIDANLKKLSDNLRIFAQKEIERDKYFVRKIKELNQSNMFAYFGLSHRTISHLLERDGLKIPFEIIGEVALDPEEKLTLLLKYELLGLDPSELRNDDIAKDCDQSKKEFYLDLAPDYFGFEDLNKKGFDHISLVNYFWKNLNKITGRKIK